MRSADVRSVGVSGRDVVDRRRTRCVREQLAATRIADAPKTAQRLRIPVMFFWSEEQEIDEATGRVVSHPLQLKGVKREMNLGAGSPMPAIDEFHGR